MSQEKKMKINGTPTQVTAKRLSFFDIQATAPLLMNGNLDFSDYWKHAFGHWLTCDPPVNYDSLSPEDGAELAKLLPDPGEVMGWLVFREAKPDESDASSMGDQ
jgi:hypothetical protein